MGYAEGVEGAAFRVSRIAHAHTNRPRRPRPAGGYRSRTRHAAREPRALVEGHRSRAVPAVRGALVSAVNAMMRFARNASNALPADEGDSGTDFETGEEADNCGAERPRRRVERTRCRDLQRPHRDDQLGHRDRRLCGHVDPALSGALLSRGPASVWAYRFSMTIHLAGGVADSQGARS